MNSTKDKLRMLAILSLACLMIVSTGTYFYFKQMNTSALVAGLVFIGYYILFCIAMIFLSLKYSALEKREEVDDEIIEVQEVVLEPVGIATEQTIEEVKEVVIPSHASLIAQQLKNNADAFLQSTEDLRDVYTVQQITVSEPIEQPVRQVRNVGKYRYGRSLNKHARIRRVR